KGQCIRSNAGLWYQNYDEFRECMKLLLKNDDLRIKMGENGKTFVEENYSWETVEKKYLNLLEKLERK
ncbi:MAG: glycosyltransferase, partial [Methanohalophilus sp. T328-1]